MLLRFCNLFPPSPCPQIHMTFIAYKVALEPVSLQVLQFSLVSIMEPILHTSNAFTHNLTLHGLSTSVILVVSVSNKLIWDVIFIHIFTAFVYRKWLLRMPRLCNCIRYTSRQWNTRTSGYEGFVFISVSTCVALNKLMCCTSCRTGLYIKITSGLRFLYNSESFGIMEEREARGKRRGSLV